MVHVNKLKGKIVENGLRISYVADHIGMDRATLYRRLKEGGEDFTVKEITRLSKLLNLTGEEINDIFFNSEVA